MIRRHRTDGNAAEIYREARRLGFRLNVVNNALCDTVAQLCGLTELWEVKNGRAASYTALQKKMREAGWVIRTIRSIDDLLQARAEMTRAGAAVQKSRLGD